MPIIQQLDCPYCSTKSSGFQAVGAFNRSKVHQPTGTGSTNYKYESWLLLSCGRCRKCVSGVYEYEKRGSTPIELPSLLQQHGSPSDFGYQYVGHFPKAASIDEPNHVPDNVVIPFRQASSNIASSNWDAAGTMARKTLEVATKDIVRRKFQDPETQDKLIKKTWLKGRIQKLFEAGYLTKELSELAVLIKDEGDDATHDEAPYEENNARELLGYSQALLTYVYTIPGMVSEVRKKLEGTQEISEI